MTFAQATQLLALRFYVVEQGTVTNRYYVRNPKGKACFAFGQSELSVIALAESLQSQEEQEEEAHAYAQDEAASRFEARFC